MTNECLEEQEICVFCSKRFESGPILAGGVGLDGFIDIHTHILPAVDDGAKDISVSRQMVRRAWENGTRTLILTPHYRGAFRDNTPAWLRESFSILCELIEDDLPDMRLCLGCEIYYETDAPEKLTRGGILTLNNSDYVLVEYRTGVLRSNVIASVDEIVRCGFTPILAHVERYDCFRKEPELLLELRNMGALLQLNADSVLGIRGAATKRFCRKLLKKQTVQFIASDAHDVGERPPLLRDCWSFVRKENGDVYAAELFYENAQAVIENRIL